MYVCVCMAITDKQVEEAQKHSSSFKEVCSKLGLGTECGSCLQEALFQYEAKSSDAKPRDKQKS